MHPDLEHLRAADLQDLAIRDLRKKKKVLEDRLAGARTRVTETTKTLADLDAALAANATHQRDVQRSVESYEARRTSAVNVLENGGGDPEAAQRQVDSVSIKLDAFETDLLESMEAAESLTAQRAEAQTNHAAAVAFLEAEEATHPPAIAALRASFDAVLPLRKAALDALDDHLVDRYETLLARKGRALSEIKAGSCSACQMVVRQQHIADLERGRMQTCGGCGRWLLLTPTAG